MAKEGNSLGSSFLTPGRPAGVGIVGNGGTQDCPSGCLKCPLSM